MKAIGHHTCSQSGGIDHVRKEAPFKSLYEPEKGSYPFLGEGYYYWDDNIEQAKWWGRKHYKNDYFVVENQLNLHPDVFLDLVGNRQDMKLLIAIIKDLENKGYDRHDWSLMELIQYLKEIEKKNEGFFPFKVFRAVDFSASNDDDFSFYFVVGGKSYTNLSPRYVICFIEKNDLILQPNEIVRMS